MKANIPIKRARILHTLLGAWMSLATLTMLQAQVIYPGSIELNSQTEVDEFPFLYECTEISGDLTITASNIRNVDGLSRLTFVGGTVVIEGNVVLEDLDGLSSLAEIGGALRIVNNDALTNLDGFSALASVGSGVSVNYNRLLTNLDGLSALSFVGFDLTVFGNSPTLSRCCGLFPLLDADGVTGDIHIGDNGTVCEESDIASGGFCGPGAYIEDLYEAGVLNKGIANVLNKKLAYSPLYAFINEVNAFVNSGKLSLAQGQTLILIASLPDGSAPSTTGSLPESFELGQNYPNPTKAYTHIPFTIVESGRVILKIFDDTGREIRTLVNEDMKAGVHHVKFDTEELPAGMYFYHIQSGEFSDMRPLMVD